MLIVDGEFFLFLSCQHLRNFVPTDHPTIRRSSVQIVSFPFSKSFKHNIGTDRIDKQTIRKCIWHLDARFGPKNPRCSPKQDSTLKTHSIAGCRIQSENPMAQPYTGFYPENPRPSDGTTFGGRANILSILFGTSNRTQTVVL